MKICSNCKRENDDSSQFCQYCGRKLEDAVPPKMESTETKPNGPAQWIALGIAGVMAIALLWGMWLVISARISSNRSNREHEEKRNNIFRDQEEGESDFDSSDWEYEAEGRDVFDFVDSSNSEDKRRRCLEYKVMQRERYKNGFWDLRESEDWVDIWQWDSHTCYYQGELVYLNDSGEYVYKDGQIYLMTMEWEGEQVLYFDDGELFCWKDEEGTCHYEEWDNRRYREMASYAEDGMRQYYNYWNIPDWAEYEGWGECEYLFYTSDREYIPNEYVEGLDQEYLKLAHYEILARHGRRFDELYLQDYFDSMTWYDGFIEPSEFDPLMDEFLNDYEKYNLNLIMQHELY